MSCNFTLDLALDKELLKVHLCSYTEIWEHTPRIFPPPGSLGNCLTSIFQQSFKAWQGVSVNFIDVLNITHELHSSRILPDSPKWSLCRGENCIAPAERNPFSMASAVSFYLWVLLSPQHCMVRTLLWRVLCEACEHMHHIHLFILQLLYWGYVRVSHADPFLGKSSWKLELQLFFFSYIWHHFTIQYLLLLLFLFFLIF